MIIKTIDEASEIVDSNNSLSWDGWNIIHLRQDDYAEYLSIGVFNKSDGKWYRKTVFSYDEDGWNIPDELIA